MHVEVASHLRREARFTGRRDQRRQVGEIVPHIGLRIEHHRVGGVLRGAIETALIALLVDRIEIKRDGRHHTRLVVKQLLDHQIGFVGALQLRNELGNLATQRKLLRIVGLHDRHQCAGRFRRRGQVIHRLFRHRLLTCIIQLTKSLVIDDMAILGHQHLTAGIGFRLQSLRGNAVYLRQTSDI